MNSTPQSQMSRICPWCAQATVIAFSADSLTRALVRHLETCPGEQPTDRPGAAR